MPRHDRRPRHDQRQSHDRCPHHAHSFPPQPQTPSILSPIPLPDHTQPRPPAAAFPTISPRPSITLTLCPCHQNNHAKPDQPRHDHCPRHDRSHSHHDRTPHDNTRPLSKMTATPLPPLVPPSNPTRLRPRHARPHHPRRPYHDHSPALALSCIPVSPSLLITRTTTPSSPPSLPLPHSPDPAPIHPP